MPTFFISLAVVITLWATYKYFFSQAPLIIDKDDPIMQQAYDDARKNLDKFITMVQDHNNEAHVKIRFTTDVNEEEILWAELLSPPNDLTNQHIVNVRLLNYPVSQRTSLEQEQSINSNTIVDWRITTQDGKYHGAYTHHAMIDIANRDNIKLPRPIAQELALYEKNNVNSPK